jgi:hypothetical protein
MRSNTAAKSDFTRELLLDDSISSRSNSKNLSTVSDILYLDMIENSGLYIEIGPGNGIEDSLTLHLENSGWRGLLIEKYTDKFAACILNRPNSAVVNDDCLSDSNGRKLVDILKEYDIHEAKLLVINQEGNIAGTLKEMLRSDFKPATLIFSKAVSNIVHNLLTLRGYRLQEQKGDTSQCGIICYRRQKAFRNITPFENKPIQKDRVSLLKNNSLMEMSKVNNLETDLKILEKEAHQYLIDILSIVKHKSNFLDGNLFYVNMIEAENVIPSEELKTKRENFLFLTKNANKILEIGFNAGHSTLIALLANKKSKITVIDTCEHIYTEETFNYLSSKFPNRLKLIKGNSTKILPSIKDKFDLIHFDGGKEKTILKDLEYSKNIVKSEHILIIDDYGHWEGCRKAVDDFFEENNLNIDDLIYIDYTCRVFIKKDHNIALKGALGGGWDEETHLKLYAKNFNQGMANYLVKEIAPKSFLEFGSGLGFLAKHIDENLDLESSFCIEPNYIRGLYGQMSNVKLLQLDIFKDDIPREIDQKFDLVISIEVAEHIERNKHNFLFDFLVNKTKNWLVFSGARIGQGGHGHISERAEDDWKGEFLSRGMIFDEQRTKNIRNACDKKNINHRKNVMVFHKPSFVKVKNLPDSQSSRMGDR